MNLLRSDGTSYKAMATRISPSEQQAVLKINGKDTYLQSVQQNGAPVLQETSNRDGATKFEVTGNKDQRFQLTDLPGGSTFEKISKDDKTCLWTSNDKYVKLENGRIEETENVDQCLEVEILAVTDAEKSKQ